MRRFIETLSGRGHEDQGRSTVENHFDLLNSGAYPIWKIYFEEGEVRRFQVVVLEPETGVYGRVEGSRFQIERTRERGVRVILPESNSERHLPTIQLPHGEEFPVIRVPELKDNPLIADTKSYGRLKYFIPSELSFGLSGYLNGGLKLAE